MITYNVTFKKLKFIRNLQIIVQDKHLNKMKIPRLPMEIMDEIVLYTGDSSIANVLKDKISQYVLDRIEKNILIYGNVQGGKTAEIFNYINENSSCQKVLVIQNSLLVLKQYEQRLRSKNIDYQIIDKNTQEITKNLVLVLNNKYRYNYFRKVEPRRYILMLDESDQTIRSCSIKTSKNIRKTVHITATPFNRTLYNRCIRVPENANYYGVEDLNINLNYADDNTESVEKFLKTQTGIMLINKYSYVSEMTYLAKKLTLQFPNVPVVLLTSEKIMLLNNQKRYVKQKSISKIIDSLQEHKHIIFIANRLSSRGLSYVSSDYTRHLTFQITRVRTSITSFLQSLRILGIYNCKNKLNLELVINDHEEKLFKKHVKFLNNFDIEEKMLR